MDFKKILVRSILFFMVIIAAKSCGDEFYDNGGQCDPCHYSCLTCDGDTTTNCLSCSSGVNRHQVDTTCLCDNGYFDSGEKNCVACSHKCATCTDNTDNCGTCGANRGDAPLCPCQVKFFDDGTSEACVACSHKCATCDDIGDHCLTCGAHRVAIPNCLCSTKYYDDNVTEACLLCSHYCATCDDIGDHCLTCGAHRVAIPNCLCSTKYYDDNVTEACLLCSHYCATCDDIGDHCLTCGANRLSIPNCLCQDKFFDDGSTQACLNCNILCKTCQIFTVCTSCNATAHRQLSSIDPICICMKRYFSVGIQQCSPCTLPCYTCATTSTNCTACSFLAHRLLLSNTCICEDGYFEVSSSIEQCSPCDSRCVTCTSTYVCTSCNSTAFRTLLGSSCPCQDGYYQNAAFVLCYPCHESCETCTNNSACVTCEPSTLQILNSSHLCSCNSTTFFDIVTQVCSTCSYQCLSCQLSTPTSCQTCPLNAHRTYFNYQCPCDLYYFDDAETVCVRCHYSCLSCNSIAVDGCLSCSTALLRTQNVTTCLCTIGAYDDGINEACQPCQYSCLSCAASDSCLTCNSTLHRIKDTTFCSCAQYYYETASMICLPCRYVCNTCRAADTCSSCSASKFREFDAFNRCGCMTGYYDDGINELCLPCAVQCLTCTNSSACTSCSPANYRILQGSLCPCMQGYWGSTATCSPCLYECLSCSSGTTCLSCNAANMRVLNVTNSRCYCSAAYYDDGSSSLCGSCSYACTTCQSSSTNCVTCPTGRTLTSSNWCSCPQHTYDNNVSNICQNCQYTCQTCSQGLACLQCNATKFRIFDSVNQYCICQPRYYDSGVETCLACSYTCLTCTNSSACLTCDPANFRERPAFLCPCAIKYYDTGVATCVACQYTCESCVIDYVCATCDSAVSHRVLSSASGYCVCQTRYFDNFRDENCQPCPYSCLTCTSVGHCLTCNSTAKRQLSSSFLCVCSNGYYDVSIEMCSTCQYTCGTCVILQACQTCSAAKFRTMSNITGLCICLDGYYDNGVTQLCSTCDASCKTCLNSATCTSCDPAKQRLLNSTMNALGVTSPYCVCQYGMYSLGAGLGCASCHYQCQICSGPNINNCLYCNVASNRVLSGTFKCSCINGYYDDNATLPCKVCSSLCLTCFNALASQCLTCQSSYFYLASVTTCFVSCPSTYFGNTANMRCESCSANCVTCVNQSVCTACAVSTYLYHSACLLSCPSNTFSSNTAWTCTDCPSVCPTCQSSTYCLSCLSNYYMDTSMNFCYICNSSCNTCFGPSGNQCLTCASPLVLKSYSCLSLDCPYGQYVDPIVGCKSCPLLYPNSVTCTYSRPLTCVNLYQPTTTGCVSCADVVGFHIIASTNTCTQICGDGLVIILPCDDGNNLNGDGCSANCAIEKGWTCTNKDSSSPSVCTLTDNLTLTLVSFTKYVGVNTVEIVIGLSLPIRIDSGFSINIDNVSSSSYNWTITQKSDFSAVTFKVDYSQHLQGHTVNVGFAQSRLLMQLPDEVTQLAVSHPRQLGQISIQASFPITAMPPVTYYGDSVLTLFANVQMVFSFASFVLLGVCGLLVIFKMHLLSLILFSVPAQIYIGLQIAVGRYTNWIVYSLQGVGCRAAAAVGGLTLGQCCTIIGSPGQTYYYNSQMSSNAGGQLLILIITWLLYAVMRVYHKCFSKIYKQLIWMQYYLLTITLACTYHISYSSTNALYYTEMLSPLETVNTAFAIFLLMGTVAVVISIWGLSNQQYYIKDNISCVAVASQNALVGRVIPMSRQDISRSTKIIMFSDDNPINKNDYSGQLKKEDSQNNTQNDTSMAGVDITDMSIGESLGNNSCTKGERQQQRRQYRDILIFDYLDQYKNIPRRVPQKYFLPIHLTKMSVMGILSAVLVSIPYVLIIVLLSLQCLFAGYLLIFRPFKSALANWRLFIISALQILIYVLTVCYFLLSQSYYLQGAVVLLLLITTCAASLIGLMALLSLLLQKLGWASNKIIPDESKTQDQPSHQALPISTAPIISVNEMLATRQQTKHEQVDAFSKIVMNDNINRQYRRRRRFRT